MKIYVIDTNFIHLDYFLRGTFITALAHSASKLNHDVYMPQVVYDELCKQYYEEIDQLESSFKSVKKTLYKLSPEKYQCPDYDFQKLKVDYEQILTQRCQDLGVIILEYPSVSHRDMVKRELNKRKPYKDSTKGYRDALIWETVLQAGKKLRKNGTLVLLTNNIDDFANPKDKANFHPDLLDDCKDKNIPDNKIQLVSDFKQFIHNEIIPAFEKLNESFDELQKNLSVGNIDLRDLEKNYLDRNSLQHLFDYNTLSGPIPYAPEYYENIWLHYAAPRQMRVVDVCKVTDGEVLITVQLEFDFFIDVLIFKGDLAFIDDQSMPVIYDQNVNEHYVAATDSGLMIIQLDILTDTDFQGINNVDDQVMSAAYDTGFRYTN